MKSFSPQAWKGYKKDSQASLDRKLVYSLSSSSKFPKWKQFKYLNKVLPKWQNNLIRVLILLIIANLGFLGWSLYLWQTDPIPKNGGQYIEGLVGAPQYINPILIQSNDVDRDLSHLVYSGLLKYGANRKLETDLAEKYDISPDGKNYTFYLKKNLTFSDKDNLNADDVIFTIQKIQDPVYKSPLYISFKDVKAEKVDDYTIKISLPKPFAPFLDLMSVGILPKHIWEKVAAESFALNTNNLKPIGSGPWKFKSLQKEKDGTVRSITLVRNDNFYGQKPYLDSIVFKFYPDTESAIQALKNQNILGVSYLPRDLKDRLQKNSSLQYYTFSLPQYAAVFFNPRNNEDLKTKAVRQALALATNRQAIIDQALKGEGQIVNGPILPGFIGYKEQLKKYDYDLEKAKDLLAAANWQKDDQGFWYKPDTAKKTTTSTTSNKTSEKTTATKTDEAAKSNKKYLSIQLATVDQPEYVEIANLIKDEWTKLGVKVEVNLIDPAAVSDEVINNRSYQAFIYSEIIGSDPDLYPFWHSSQIRPPGLNLAVFTNAEADKLLELGRTTADPAKRQEIYAKFQDILAEDLPVIFLYNPTYNYVVDKSIKGIADKKQIVYTSDRFIDLSSWYLKTSRQWKKK